LTDGAYANILCISIILFFQLERRLCGMKVQDYISVHEAAGKWDVTARQVQKMCSEGKIPGVVRFGRSWAIPCETAKPTVTRQTKPGVKRKAETGGR
jgi:hypothetical protein